MNDNNLLLAFYGLIIPHDFGYTQYLIFRESLEQVINITCNGAAKVILSMIEKSKRKEVRG